MIPPDYEEIYSEWKRSTAIESSVAIAKRLNISYWRMCMIVNTMVEKEKENIRRIKNGKSNKD